MTLPRIWRSVAILTLAPLLASAAQDNQVNERLPASNTEREAHWGINCTALVTTLAAGNFSCPLDEQLLQHLKLCSFIYQPPGEDPGLPCPDYRALLKRAGEERCEAFQAFTRQLHC